MPQLLPVQTSAPEQVAGQQRGGGIGRSPAHSTGNRDLLDDLQPDPAGGAGGVGQQPSGTVGQVPLIGRYLVGVSAAHLHGDLIGNFSDHVLIQADCLEHRSQPVVAILAQPARTQGQVDLAGGADVYDAVAGRDSVDHDGPSGRRTSDSAPSGRRASGSVADMAAGAPRSAAGTWAAAAIAANAATSRRSPRSVGSTPARMRICSAAAAEPAQPARAARSVLRRWANAASITAKVCSRPAAAAGDGRRTRRTRAESTPGTGQKIERPIEPARVALAYQAAFADGTP